MSSGPGAALFPRESGTYILILLISTAARLTIGKRGDFEFTAGWYAYVGSAFGPGGLRGRLKHHLAPVSRPHWHIDYLRAAVTVREIWYAADDTRHEHHWAVALHNLPGATIPVLRFGASDCTCAAHLIKTATQPDFVAFCELAAADTITKATIN